MDLLFFRIIYVVFFYFNLYKKSFFLRIFKFCVTVLIICLDDNTRLVVDLQHEKQQPFLRMS